MKNSVGTFPQGRNILIARSVTRDVDTRQDIVQFHGKRNHAYMARQTHGMRMLRFMADLHLRGTCLSLQITSDR